MRHAPTRSTTAVLLALALAACADPGPAPTAPAVPNAGVTAANAAPARVVAASRWLALGRTTVGRRETNPFRSARTLALVSVAEYNAVIAAENETGAGVRPSSSGAAAGAAAAVLEGLYPLEADSVAAQLAVDAAYFGALPSESHADFDRGVAIGRTAAAAVLAYAATDGSDAVWNGTIPAGAGYWLNAPPPAQPLLPLWGRVRPWFLTSGDQFRPAPPPAFGSPAFLDGLAEVQRFTSQRTPEQLKIAQFWATGSGPGGPSGYFGAIASQLSAARRLDERQTSRVLAITSMAVMDASIGCFDAKYTYWSIRPFQVDPSISTPVGRPNFPSYPSAHSCLSSAAAKVLARLFPEAGRDLEAQVKEAGLSRIYAGLHYRFDVVAGQQLGASVAAVALTRLPRDRTPIPLTIPVD